MQRGLGPVGWPQSWDPAHWFAGPPGATTLPAGCQQGISHGDGAGVGACMPRLCRMP